MRELARAVSSLDDPDRRTTAALLCEACTAFAERDRRILEHSVTFLRDGLEALELGDGDTCRVDLARLVTAFSALSIEVGCYYHAGRDLTLARKLESHVSALEQAALPLASLWEDHEIMRARPHEGG